MALRFIAPTSPAACLVGPVLEQEESTFIRDKVAYFSGPVILVDGAINAFEHRPQNAVIIGDADSCSADRRQWIDVLLPQNKDQSDLACALEHPLMQTSDLRFIEAWGLRGERFDHELFNLGEFHSFLTSRQQLIVQFQAGLWALAAGEYLAYLMGGFSLMAIGPCEVELSGQIDYPLERQILPALNSLGLSNRANGEFHLRLNSPLFVYEIPSTQPFKESSC